MKKIFFIITIFLLTNCNTTYKNKIGTCCDKTYTNINDAISCLSQTPDGHGTTADERLLLIVFPDKDVESNQKLGWDIIKDQDIIKTAKRNYALVILDVNQYKLPNNECSDDMNKSIKKNIGKTFFVIANQAQCWFNDWTLGDKKENIINELAIGNGS